MATHVPYRDVSKEAPDVAGAAHVIVDSSDPNALAQWWRRLLGGELRFHNEDESKLDAPGITLYFVAVPGPKREKNRLHLDLHCRDFRAAVNQALALGATPAPEVYEGEGWFVLRDPEGNEFCILNAPPPTGPEPPPGGLVPGK